MIRPTRGRLLLGSALTLSGAIFGLSGLGEPETQILMPVVGLFFGSMGLAIATASASVTSDGIRYRYGVIRRRVSASDVESVDVGPGNGAEFIALRIHRRGGKPVRLIGVQRRVTDRGRREFNQRAEEIAAIVHGMDT